MATATKRYMNWSGVSFTPTGGTLISITGVSSVKIDVGGSIAKFAADGDRYNSTMVNDFNEPTIQVSSGDIAALNQLQPGMTGTFSATLNDAKNGIATGAITYTFLSIVQDVQASGKHRAYGEGTLMLEGTSADGTTNPLSTSVAP